MLVRPVEPRLGHAPHFAPVGRRYQLARTFHHSKRKIRQILAEDEPKAYPLRPSGPSILDPFKPVIDAVLKADETAPPKQRHTAAKIFRRLRDEHNYQGGPERVRLYVRSLRSGQSETSSPWTTTRASASRPTSATLMSISRRAAARWPCCWRPGRTRIVPSPSR